MSEPLTTDELAAFARLMPVLEWGDSLAKLKAENERLREELDVYKKDDLDAKPLAEAVCKLEAENAQMRVCGTCGHFINVEYEMCDIPNEFSVDPEYVGAQDPCRFDPPRWTPYWTVEP
jgi:hypothetical protein